MPQNRSQNNCGSTKTVKFEYLMKLLLRRMVKNQVTRTLFVWEDGL